MRINPDTKDALLFATGLLGIVAQGILAAFGVAPSLPLIGAYLAMCGIATWSSAVWSTGPIDPNSEQHRDEPPPAKRKRRREARGDAAEGGEGDAA